MRKSNILCKSLSTVESLGSVDVIASDKTGTLTLNIMTAVNVAFGAENRYSVEEALELVRKDVNGAECVKALAAIAAVCNDAEFESSKGDEPRKINGDATGVFFIVQHCFKTQQLTEGVFIRYRNPALLGEGCSCF